LNAHLSKSKFHFIGIGGIGMCGLAELLHNMGAKVSGSDRAENANTLRLRNLGLKVYIGHDYNQVQDVDVVVYSSAVQSDNVEMIAAKEKNIPIIPRAEVLAEIMLFKRGVAIAGTHGKTTTTSIVTSIFLNAKLDPTIVVGARLDMIKSTALLGKGDWLIAEADESDGSFHRLSPEIAVITNIDNDHLDHYENFQNLKQAFYNFAHKTPFYGSVIVCGDDVSIKEVFQNFSKRIFTYGFLPHNDYQIEGQKGQYKVRFKNQPLGSFQIQVPGKHNALNALAAIIVGLRAGLDFETCAAGVCHYQGVDRRFQLKGEAKGISVFDDYGHHPTEVLATLQAFKEKFPERNLVVLFQPHRYSRTAMCWNEFLKCFGDADQLYISDIYAAGEAPQAQITSERLVKEIHHNNKTYIAKADLNAKFFTEMLKPNDIFVTLGAGDLWKLGLAVLEDLEGLKSR
jgi:UDP-N-acetylmuramate--alanine ligase